MKFAHVLGIGPIIAFRLYIDLPGPSKPVEVIDEVAAHECLQRLINLVQIDSLLQNLVAIDVDEDLRDGGQKGGNDAADLRSFTRGFDKLVHVLREEADVFPGAIFQREGKSARRATPGDGRRG